MKSVDAGGENEVLDYQHNLDWTEVKQELFKLLLVSAAQNEGGSEDKYTSRKIRQDFKSLKANNPVQKHVHLYMLQDNSSPEHEATWEFFDRRIDNVLELGKILSKNSNLASAVSTGLLSIFSILKPTKFDDS